MPMSSRFMAWLMLVLNIILIGLVATMHNMAAMWLMAIIMTLDSIVSLAALYHRPQNR